MEYNNVKLLSEHNQCRIFVDGTEIRHVTGFDIRQDIKNCATIISIDFICDLNTAELKKARFLINEHEYEKLQELAKPLQEWLLKHYNMMCSIRIDSERAVVMSDKVSVPFDNE